MKNLNNVIIKKVQASEIKAGDCINIEGVATTVSKSFIKYDPFLGITIYGQNFRNGVELVLFPKYFKGQLIGHFSQI
jgi:hypothetical protein